MAKRGRVYNKFYTDELWEQVNKENKRILEDFLSEYKQRKKSKGTINGYRSDLKIILIYVLKELVQILLERYAYSEISGTFILI